MKEILGTIAVISAIAGLCRAFYKKGHREGWKDAFKHMAACRAANEERKYSHFSKKKHSKKQGEKKGQSKVTA